MHSTKANKSSKESRGKKMIKLLNKQTKIEKELCKTTKIFGENYNVQIIYKKIQNPELDLYQKTITIYLPHKYKRTGNMPILKLALEKMYDEIARIEIENVMEETRVMLNGLAPENYIIKRIPNKPKTNNFTIFLKKFIFIT